MSWLEGLQVPDETKGFVTSQGWDKLDPAQAALAAVTIAREAQTRLGGPLDEMLRVPKDTSDAAWNTVYERMGVPKDATAYDLSSVKRLDGSAPPPEWVENVRQIAAANKMTNAQAVAFAQGQVAFDGQQSATSAEQNRIRAEAEKVALKQAWGPEHDLKMFRATKAAELLGLSPDVLQAVAEKVGFVKTMDQLNVLGSRMSESELLGGGAGSSGPKAYTREQAVARRAELMQSQEFGQRFVNGDERAVAEMTNLNRIIVAGAG